jgi:uncharacterized protein YyaL (SSP411 family)
MYDHLGFGFHRYSTDARWLVPHFEKMLYDQALLAIAYTEAYQATGKIQYRETAEEILVYVIRDMTGPEGGFYSAEDADAEGEEGKSYLWTEEEIRQNILYLKKPLEELAVDLGLPAGELKAGLAAIRKKLYAVRTKRPRPFKDKKILTDWNGLMIAALAKAAQAFDEPAHAAAAVRAADFILEKMVGPDGAIYHRFVEGEASYSGFLDDYAFLIWGLLELYEAVFDVRYLETAFRLCDYALAHFWDKAQGGFYFVPEQSSEVPFRDKEAYDGAYPSGNSVMMLNMIRLGRIGGRAGFEEKARQAGQAFSRRISQAPSAYTYWMTALEFALAPSLEVVIAGDPDSADTKAMLQALRQLFLPSKVVLVRQGDAQSSKIVKVAPFTKDMKVTRGKATAYICTNYGCQHPTTDPRKMLEFLGGSFRPIQSRTR